jgi:murein DD-endopeptidase MepM/ murein hydrolase activator NlpD
MAKSEKRKNNWRDKFRFAIFNDTTYEEVWRLRLTKYNALLVTSFCLFLIIFLTSTLIAFTNLREFIPGYPDVTLRRAIVMNALMLDSLEHEIDIRDNYFRDLNDVISGKQTARAVSSRDTTKDYKRIAFRRSPADSLLRTNIEHEEQYSLTPSSNVVESGISLTSIHFFPPVKGVISANFDTRTRHFGTDIVTAPKAIVSSTLDGTVIMTGWTMETGFVIIVQHNNNLISVYKHNSTLLKEMGDRVWAGEAIALVGDSGELYTSGPHLHFELWYKGEPLNATQFIFF